MQAHNKSSKLKLPIEKLTRGDWIYLRLSKIVKISLFTNFYNCLSSHQCHSLSVSMVFWINVPNLWLFSWSLTIICVWIFKLQLRKVWVPVSRNFHLIIMGILRKKPWGLITIWTWRKNKQLIWCYANRKIHVHCNDETHTQTWYQLTG